MTDGRPDSRSFTGQARTRTTSRRVRVVDRVARTAITAGGLLTIAAVATVCMFLVWIALPLAGRGSADAAGAVANPAHAAVVVRLAEDPHRRVAWLVQGDGQLVAFATEDGRILESARLFEPPGVQCLAALGGQFLLQSGTGAVQFATVEFETSVIAADTPGLPPLRPGQVAVRGATLFERTTDSTWRRQDLRIRRDEPTRIADAPIVHADFADTGSGVAIVALCRDGVLHTKLRATRHDLLEDREIVEWSGASVPLTQFAADLRSELPEHTLLAGRGDNVYLVWRDGRLLRLDTRDLERPVLAERVDLLAAGRTIRSLAFLAGKSTMLVGDDAGVVTSWFRIRTPETPTADGCSLVRARAFDAADPSPVVALDSSARSRLFVAAHGSGAIRVWHGTSERLVAEVRADANDPVVAVALCPKEDGVIAAGTRRLQRWNLAQGHPEVTLATAFRPVWYEGAAEPEHVWQSTGASDDFEPKLGLWPLIYGTLKATFYCLLFGVPAALLAAVYTSEFLHPRWRARVKPVIELMASLPSVVLGFLAGLVVAPFVAAHLMAVLLALLVVPFVFLAAAQLWQKAPPYLLPAADRWRIPAALVAVPVGLLLAQAVAPSCEQALFGGDLVDWLAATAVPAGDPRRGSAFGGLLLVVLPLAALLALLLLGRLRLPAIAAGTPLRRFVAGTVAALGLAIALAAGLSAAGFDLRGNVFGVFDPRNSLVVGLAMGFAVVPIVYTIAEDALAAVPEHLRAASLGAGATPWQTAVRVVFPTAMSGVFSAVMVGLGRAVGETMIVVMAVGGTAVIDPNIFNGFRTLSANIATELPEAVRDSTHYRMLYLAALCLFAMTFALNTVAEAIRQRFRRRAFQL